MLTPGHVTPRGWTAMRNVVSFDGTARELLTDLAANGGVILCVDNLDLFGDEGRTTVVDLVRAAADIPGLSVIATARRSFGVDEPSWLPADAIKRLGPAEPVIVGELSDTELNELRHAATHLAAFRRQSARSQCSAERVRLARLANRQSDEPVPRTEVDMAELWWRTADGRVDSGHYRDRARLLKALAEQALVRGEPLDVSDRSSGRVNALIASETLRDLGNDRVAFRHDVLREWAIANLLTAEPHRLDQLLVRRPAPALLCQPGVELATRFALERNSDTTRWRQLLDLMSRDGVHGSWRRPVLLALVRSEIADQLLDRACDLLLADNAALLRELIRLVMAVDARPARDAFRAFIPDPSLVPVGINVPSGPSWLRLILWLLRTRRRPTPPARPDVVDLYGAWSVAVLGRDPLTPYLAAQLHAWLVEIEADRAGAQSAGAERNRLPIQEAVDREEAWLAGGVEPTSPSFLLRGRACGAVSDYQATQGDARRPHQKVSGPKCTWIIVAQRCGSPTAHRPSAMRTGRGCAAPSEHTRLGLPPPTEQA